MAARNASREEPVSLQDSRRSNRRACQDKMGKYGAKGVSPTCGPVVCLFSMLRARYYLADGVKLYSQETWRMMMGDRGRDMVGRYAKDVVEYYCVASELDNHCIRESACHSIAEMAEKVCLYIADQRAYASASQP